MNKQYFNSIWDICSKNGDENWRSFFAPSRFYERMHFNNSAIIFFLNFRSQSFKEGWIQECVKNQKVIFSNRTVETTSMSINFSKVISQHRWGSSVVNSRFVTAGRAFSVSEYFVA